MLTDDDASSGRNGNDQSVGAQAEGEGSTSERWSRCSGGKGQHESQIW